jgi:polyhydroxybutyrate depolymerase
VVVILHGSGSEGPVYLDRAGWASEADRAGFLAVAPDAQRMRPSGAASNAVNPRRWNSGQLPPGSQRAGIDDVGFLLKMLDDLGNRWAIDPNRVYVAGHSNGGSMAFKVVDEASEKFAAMASVGGHCYVADPAPAVPLPTVFMLGSEDPLMPLAGGRSVLPWEIRDTPPFRWTTDRWAEALGAAARPTKVEKLPDATRMVFGPVPNGAELVCLIVLRQGHNWPGAPDFVVERAFLGPNRSPVQATPNLWAFFDKYERG